MGKDDGVERQDFTVITNVSSNVLYVVSR